MQMLSFMNAQFSLFQQGYNLLDELDPYMKKLAAEVSKVNASPNPLPSQMPTGGYWFFHDSYTLRESPKLDLDIFQFSISTAKNISCCLNVASIKQFVNPFVGLSFIPVWILKSPIFKLHYWNNLH